MSESLLKIQNVLLLLLSQFCFQLHLFIIHSFIYLFIHSFIYLFIHSFIYSFIYLFIVRIIITMIVVYYCYYVYYHYLYYNMYVVYCQYETPCVNRDCLFLESWSKELSANMRFIGCFLTCCIQRVQTV